MSSMLVRPKLFILDLALCTAGAVLLPWLVLSGEYTTNTYLSLLRLLLSLLDLFVVPGYLLQLAFFPRWTDLTATARMGLSLTLSVALVVPVALLLEWLPWGIKTWPITAVWVLILAILLPVAGFRRWQVGSEEWPALPRKIQLFQGWQDETRSGRFLLGTAVLALSIALLAGIVLAFTPDSSRHFTEFFVLSPSGTAAGYPLTVVDNQPVTIIAGIRNQEGHALDYTLRLRLGDEILYQSGSFRVLNQAALELPVSVMLTNPGPGQELAIELFQGSSSVPYRKLQLYINVEPSD